MFSCQINAWHLQQGSCYIAEKLRSWFEVLRISSRNTTDCWLKTIFDYFRFFFKAYFFKAPSKDPEKPVEGSRNNFGNVIQAGKVQHSRQSSEEPETEDTLAVTRKKDVEQDDSGDGAEEDSHDDSNDRLEEEHDGSDLVEEAKKEKWGDWSAGGPSYCDLEG